MAFHQIFRVCLAQEFIELIKFWGVSGNNFSMAGDIETNPGPVSDNAAFCDLAVCHINIRTLKTSNK